MTVFRRRSAPSASPESNDSAAESGPRDTSTTSTSVRSLIFRASSIALTSTRFRAPSPARFIRRVSGSRINRPSGTCFTQTAIFTWTGFLQVSCRTRLDPSKMEILGWEPGSEAAVQSILAQPDSVFAQRTSVEHRQTVVSWVGNGPRTTARAAREKLPALGRSRWPNGAITRVPWKTNGAVRPDVRSSRAPRHRYSPGRPAIPSRLTADLAACGSSARSSCSAGSCYPGGAFDSAGL